MALSIEILHTHIHTHTETQWHTHTHRHTCMHTDTHTCTHTHTDIHRHTHALTHTDTHACTQTHTRAHTHIHTTLSITEVYIVLTCILFSLHSVWQEQNQILRLREAAPDLLPGWVTREPQSLSPRFLEANSCRAEGMTEMLPQRDDPRPCASEKQPVLFQTYWGGIWRGKQKRD